MQQANVSAPGFQACESFSQEADCDDDNNPVIFDSRLTLDDEASSTDSDHEHPDLENDWESDWDITSADEGEHDALDDTEPTPHTVHFDPKPRDELTSERVKDTRAAEPLKTHH